MCRAADLRKKENSPRYFPTLTYFYKSTDTASSQN